VKLQEKYRLSDVEVLRNTLKELCKEAKKYEQQSQETDRISNDASDQGNSAAMDSIEIDERDSLAINDSRDLIQKQPAIIESLKTELNILLEAAIQRSLTKEVCPDLHAAFIFMDSYKEWTWKQLYDHGIVIGQRTGLEALLCKIIKKDDSGLSTKQQQHIMIVMFAHKFLAGA